MGIKDPQLGAHQKFLKAHEQGAQSSEFYWNWGRSWFSVGLESGEAIDFKTAIEKYEQASKVGEQTSSFWKDYANALAELGRLIGREEMLVEASEYYQKTLKQDPKSLDALIGLAYCSQELYENGAREEDFQQGSNSFEQVSNLEKHDPVLWLKWGKLLTRAGQVKDDLLLFSAGLEKFKQAYVRQPKNALILRSWGEALLRWGVKTESIHFLRCAEEKLKLSIDANADEPETWCAYGHCLVEQGHYFDDGNMYLQAIEKLQQALSHFQNDPLLWHILALAYLALGELCEDEGIVQKAVALFARVHEFETESGQLWNDWGVALIKLAEMTEKPHYAELATEKLEHAFSINSREVEWLTNYAYALELLGDLTEEPSYYGKASQVFLTVMKLEASDYARYHLALTLSHLGESISDMDYLRYASEQFAVLLTEDFEDGNAWNDWGANLLHLAELSCDINRPQLHEQAESKFMQAAALGNEQAYYHLACVYSLMRHYPKAIHYLERSGQCQALPPTEDLMDDAWLEGLRHTEAFQNFVSQRIKK